MSSAAKLEGRKHGEAEPDERPHYLRDPPRMPPSTPRRIWRPIWLPTVRAACLAIASTMPWRRFVPQRMSLDLRRRDAACPRGRLLRPRARSARGLRRAAASLGRAAGASAETVRWLRISYADSRFTRVVVLAADRAARADRRALLRRDRAHPAARRADHRALDRHRHALLLERRHERLADAELGDDLGDVELGVGHERLGGGAHRLLVARRVGAQRVLDPVAELAEDLVRHVVGKLRAEVHAHALGADDPHDLLDALAQRRRRVVEQQVRLVEEEHQLRLVEIADLRQVLEELREQPQEEARVEPRLQDQLVGREDVDDAAAAEDPCASGPSGRAPARRRTPRRPRARARAARAGSRRSTAC